jgi:hypothetical protein
MSLVSIEISERGVERVVSSPRTISQAVRANEIQARTAFAVRLLHNQVCNNDSLAPVSEHGSICIPREKIDDEYVTFQSLPLYIPEQPREIHDGPPMWAITVARRLKPNHFVWANVDSFPGGESEAAVSLLIDEFGNASDSHNGSLDHYGWVEDEDRGTILVSEPYGLNQDQIDRLSAVCRKAGLAFRLVGFSNHYPSRTLRIEIWSA